MRPDKDLTYAIVGASRNPSKYGHIVLRDLHEAGYKVVPINPNTDEVTGLKSYPRLADVPDKIDVVVTVVPPAVTEQALMEALALGINKVWMQPGSESDEVVDYCANHNIEHSSGKCIMVARRES